MSSGTGGLSTPRRGRPPIPKQIARVLECHRCGTRVWICKRCDRGQRYCSRKCSQEARRESVREAGRRFRRTAAGRKGNARRQQRHYWASKEPPQTSSITSVAQTSDNDAPCDARRIGVRRESRESFSTASSQAEKNLTHHASPGRAPSGILSLGGNQGTLPSKGHVPHHSSMRHVAEVSREDTSAAAPCIRCHFCRRFLWPLPEKGRSSG